MKLYYTAKHEVIFMYAILKSKKILQQLLEFILEKKIEEIIVLNPNLVTDKINNRIQKLDLLIKTNKEYINVELNSNYNKMIIERNILYAFKLCSDKAEKGKRVYDINKKIIQININFNIKRYGKEEIYLYNKVRKQIVTDILKIININVENYIKRYYNSNKKFTKGEEIIIMLGLNKKELSSLGKRSEIVMEYKKLVDEVNNDDEIIKWFSAEEEQKMYEEALVRKGESKGHKAGIVEGHKAGLIEGHKAGLIEGKKKGKQDGILSVAKNMLAEGMSIDLISKLTRLNKNQINQLL